MKLLLDEAYFKDKEFKSMSSAGIRDFLVMNPEAEVAAWKKAQEIKGAFIEPAKFQSMDDATLINSMRKQTYANNPELREALIQRGVRVVPLILEKFIRSINDIYIDHVFVVISELNYDCEDYLIEHLEDFRSAYTQSIACQILGMIGSKRSVEVLDRKYEMYKKDYPNETYEQAPLYGLWHLGRRLGHHDIEYELADR